MFNNRFNSSKNDPLVEAVKAARADGNMRRQAVSIVNEAFEVYSRNAVVREDLAAYDAALEEAYNNLKEGVQIDEISKELAGKYIKSAHYRGGSADFKHGMIHGRELATRKKSKGDQADAKQHSNTSLKREKGIGLATDKLTGKAKVQANEELAKKDYDKDGKIETPKDEVWGSRFRAAKAAGKMEEKKSWEEEVDYSAPDRAAVTKDNKPVVSSTAPKADTSGPSSSDKAALTNKINSIKEAAYSAKAARAGKDIGKPGKSFEKIAAKAGEKYGSKERGNKVAGAILKKIRAKHMKEDQSFNSAQETGKSVNEGEIPSMNFGVTRDGTTYPGGKPGLASRAYSAVKNVVSKAAPIAARVAPVAARVAGPVAAGASIGATASDLVGGAMTGSKTGRAIGAAIGSTDTGKYVADKARAAGEFIGVRQPSPAKATPTTPGSMSVSAQKAPTAGPSSSAAEKVGISQKMPSIGSVAPKPAAASVSTASAPAPKPAAAPTPASAKSSYYKGGSQGDYTIKRGDTLSGIAKRTGQSVSDLASMNKISDVNKISSGAKLMTKVPTPPSRPADVSSASTPAPAPKPAEPAPAATSSAPAPMMTNFKPSGPMGDMPKMSDQPPSSVSAPKPAAPAPEPKKKEAGAVPAAPMAESVVTVGANKYRIV